MGAAPEEEFFPESLVNGPTGTKFCSEPDIQQLACPHETKIGGAMSFAATALCFRPHRPPDFEAGCKRCASLG